MSITVHKSPSPRHSSIDLSTVGFGNVFTDHMFRRQWKEGHWREGSIVPHENIPISPGCLGLHYGQAVFEGLKAYRGTQDNIIRLFRPDRNAARLAASCERLCIPTISADDLLEAISTLVAVEKEWVPHSRSETLYLRPLVFGSEGHLSVRPATSYEFLIIAAPVSEYFDRRGPGISLKAEDYFTRAAPGGMGAAKTGGNYASTLRPTGDGLANGYDQILWLDSEQHQFIEEAGQMNIFFRIGDKVITPPLAGTILPGVTRDSILRLLGEWGIESEERRISIAELRDAKKKNHLVEVFGAGTAAVVVPIKNIEFKRESIVVPDPTPEALCNRLYNELTGIQYGEISDQYGWTLAV